MMKYSVTNIEALSGAALGLPLCGKLCVEGSELVLHANNSQECVCKPHGGLQSLCSRVQGPLCAWPLAGLRRYVFLENVLQVESGRRCPSGPGVFTFTLTATTGPELPEVLLLRDLDAATATRSVRTGSGSKIADGTTAAASTSPKFADTFCSTSESADTACALPGTQTVVEVDERNTYMRSIRSPSRESAAGAASPTTTRYQLPTSPSVLTPRDDSVRLLPPSPTSSEGNRDSCERVVLGPLMKRSSPGKPTAHSTEKSNTKDPVPVPMKSPQKSKVQSTMDTSVKDSIPVSIQSPKRSSPYSTMKSKVKDSVPASMQSPSQARRSTPHTTAKSAVKASMASPVRCTSTGSSPCIPDNAGSSSAGVPIVHVNTLAICSRSKRKVYSALADHLPGAYVVRASSTCEGALTVDIRQCNNPSTGAPEYTSVRVKPAFPGSMYYYVEGTDYWHTTLAHCVRICRAWAQGTDPHSTSAGAAAAHAISLSGDGSIDDDRDMADWQVLAADETVWIPCAHGISIAVEKRYRRWVRSDGGPVDFVSESLRTLSPKDPEYIAVCARFEETCPLYRVCKIERIEQPTVWKMYMNYKNDVVCANNSDACHFANEKMLFHGTDRNTTVGINRQGFNRRYSNSDARLGLGVYFARDARYCCDNGYSVPDDEGIGRVYLARVAVGRYTRGAQGLKDAPERDADTLYDSVVDDVAYPSIFAVFRDFAAYPEYLISFDAV